MRTGRLFALGLLCAVRAGAETFQMDGVSFEFRLPQHVALPCGPDEDGATPPRVMVLFGGRGWQGMKTLETYAFDRLADTHRLVLLSPSFYEGAYWEPESGSGDILKKAVVQVCRLARVPDDGARSELYLYGYPAGLAARDDGVSRKHRAPVPAPFPAQPGSRIQGAGTRHPR